MIWSSPKKADMYVDESQVYYLLLEKICLLYVVTVTFLLGSC